MPRVLIADDNSNVQKMVSLALKDAGIEVVAVGNGEAAVRKMPEATPDLVLADIFMPVRNGYEVCEFVKRDPKFMHVPVVLLVGAFDPLDEREALRVHADGVLKKPFVPPDPLINMVTSLLSKSAGERAVAAPAAPAAPSAQPAPAAPKPTPAPIATETAVAEREEPALEEFTAKPEVTVPGEDSPLAYASLLETAVTSTDQSDPIVTAKRDPVLGEPTFWVRKPAEPEAMPDDLTEGHSWENALPRRSESALLRAADAEEAAGAAVEETDLEFRSVATAQTEEPEALPAVEEIEAKTDEAEAPVADLTAEAQEVETAEAPVEEAPSFETQTEETAMAEAPELETLASSEPAAAEPQQIFEEADESPAPAQAEPHEATIVRAVEEDEIVRDGEFITEGAPPVEEASTAPASVPEFEAAEMPKASMPSAEAAAREQEPAPAIANEAPEAAELAAEPEADTAATTERAHSEERQELPAQTEIPVSAASELRQESAVARTEAPRIAEPAIKTLEPAPTAAPVAAAAASAAKPEIKTKAKPSIELIGVDEDFPQAVEAWKPGGSRFSWQRPEVSKAPSWADTALKESVPAVTGMLKAEAAASAPAAPAPAVVEAKAQFETETAQASAHAAAPVFSAASVLPRIDDIKAAAEPLAAVEAAGSDAYEAIVAKVIERMQPTMVEIVTREILRPVVEALVKRELDQK